MRVCRRCRFRKWGSMLGVSAAEAWGSASARVGAAGLTLGGAKRVVLRDPHRHGVAQPMGVGLAGAGLAQGAEVAVTDRGDRRLDASLLSIDPFHIPPIGVGLLN